MTSVLLRPLIYFWNRYERHIRVFVLVLGFVTDLFIAKRPDNALVNILLLSYLLICAFCIIILSRRSARAIETQTQPILLLLILQFCFGALASNLLILYGRSGTPAGNLLFIGILAAMLIGNEFLQSRYSQLRFNVGVYYLLLFTYLIIAVPTFILHDIGAEAFLVSGAISLAGIALFLWILSASAKIFRGAAGAERVRGLLFIVGGIFLFYNALYFSGVIPPVPLVLKNIDVYHSILKTSSMSYEGYYEEPPWWEFLRRTSSTFHTQLGSTAYCFSSVFAPTGLSTPILHRWEIYDEARGSWKEVSEVSFPISGGREEGYRGFSIKNITTFGPWRCKVETSAGNLIGEVKFKADPGSADLSLSTRSL